MSDSKRDIVDQVLSETRGQKPTCPEGKLEWLKQQNRSIAEMLQSVTTICQMVAADPDKSSNGFQRELMDFNLEAMQQLRIEQLCQKQEEKLAELQSATERIKNELQGGRLMKKKENRIDRYAQASKGFKSKSKELSEETRDFEKKLDQCGFHEKITPQAMKRIQDMLEEKESLFKKLGSDLEIFRGVNPTESSIKLALRAMKEELDESFWTKDLYSDGVEFRE